ncbi:sulfatase-like hydrolase/transferase [Thalassoglobus polymorphus]|uniref:Sulfatase n=1 Tax=Thalassoglobus polymorphus TaxID=2527994 RepID=A0A517QN72_9PLAN|nr:sulfatase-like hydrolase/transferase [Thalassoglobus polymorphus]QDT33083.1 Sulfatase [Thalassoglobus polymorphus]
MKYFYALALLLPTALFADEENTKPNILWISAEDISAHFECYGDPHAITPNVDQLAKEGMRYTHAFTTAGVCAPCRSGIITGMYQTTLGTQHMRCVAKLPEMIQPFPTYLRQTGYYCSNNSKQDYQFKPPSGTWDASNRKAHWRNREDKSKPFFSVFNFTGCHESGIASEEKYRSVTKDLTPDQRQNADELTTFPPYYPDSPIAREDWKRNYELITAMDAWAGNLIQQLKNDGLYEETIIFFWSDHGVGLPRAKRWLYDSGTHIPLVVRIPEKYRTGDQGEPGMVVDQLVSSIDFGPTVLNLAGVNIPEHVQGEPFLGKDLPAPRKYVFGARDRMDERYDIIRMVRNQRYQYIRNYEPLKTFYQYMNTPETGATMKVLRERHEAGDLRPAANFYFTPTKPVEELYDCQTDPHELNNLADQPEYADILTELRNAHLNWVKQTRDLGLVAEPILVEREKEIGHRYGILRGKNAEAAADRLAETAALASSGESATNDLIAALDDEDSAVRYWGATGLGNIGMPAVKADQKLKEILQTDDSPVVQIAAARALCRMEQPETALPVLVEHLRNGEQWERLNAAIVLDEIDEQALPVIQEMHSALKPRPDLYAKGKYVVRVINRALNQLESTNRKVP